MNKIRFLSTKIFFLLSFILITTSSFSQKKDTTSIDTSIQDAMQDCYIVIAGASTDFNALDNLAKQLSKKSGIKYQSDLVYDSKRGMILPDTSSDEIYAGEYLLRRYDDDRISIEMMSYYTNEHNEIDRLKMIIITGIFLNKTDAAKQLKLIQQTVSTAYIKKIKLYMGCMH
jgi:hypothetical protein